MNRTAQSVKSLMQLLPIPLKVYLLENYFGSTVQTFSSTRFPTTTVIKVDDFVPQMHACSV